MSIHRFSARILAAALACGFPIGGWADDRADFEQLMTAAHEARKKAASVGSEWRDIGKFLKQAEQAATKGDLATARKLAIKARRQGELGYEQAMSQRDAVRGWTTIFNRGTQLKIQASGHRMGRDARSFIEHICAQ